MAADDAMDLLVARINEVQQGLYAFILTLVPNTEDARDVLAETNLALWKKRAEYDPRREFWPWACQFARVQVMAFQKRRQRDRLVFGEALLEKLAGESQPQAALAGPMELALEECLGLLSVKQRELLGQRYQQERSIAEIAEQSRRTAGAVSDALYRVRLALAACIKGKLANDEARRG